MGDLVRALNFGYVRLVDCMGSDLSIVRSARVSYNAEWRTGEDEGKDSKLIEYLVTNLHTTPLESVVFTFEVKAPIFVFRQWQRHRIGWSYNEVSARYSELPEEYYIPDVSQITTQSKDNKQMRTDQIHPQAEMIQEAISTACGEAFSIYRDLLKRGCPRELARGVLPTNAYSRMFTTMNLHSLMHFLSLRLHEHAQYEIRVYAEAMMKEAEKVVPVAMAAIKKSLGV